MAVMAQHLNGTALRLDVSTHRFRRTQRRARCLARKPQDRYADMTALWMRSTTPKALI